MRRQLLYLEGCSKSADEQREVPMICDEPDSLPEVLGCTKMIDRREYSHDSYNILRLGNH
jgi:hypothetical protein